MKNPVKSPAAMNLGLLIVRIPVGLIMLFAGFLKFKGGVGSFVNQAIGAAPKYLPDAAARGYLYALPAVELFIGLLLLLGWWTRLTAFIASLVLISIIMAVTGIVAENTDFVPHSNVVLLSVTLMLMLVGPGAYAFDNIKLGGSSVKGKAAE